MKNLNLFEASTWRICLKQAPLHTYETVEGLWGPKELAGEDVMFDIWDPR